MPGVLVTVKHDESGISRSLAIGPDGRYRPTALRPWPYAVVAELAGFSNATRTGVTLTVGSTATVNLTMTVAGGAESITVTGSAPLIDTATAEVGVVNTRGVFPQFERGIAQANRNYLWSGKTDVQLSPSQSLTARYTRHRTLTPSENAGGAVTEEAAYPREGKERMKPGSSTRPASSRSRTTARWSASTAEVRV